LWKTAAKTPEAAQALKMTAKDLHAFGIVDEILEEPLVALTGIPRRCRKP